MAFQIESGACTNRGFADVDANGYLAKFLTWVVKAAAAGGPGWNLLYDKSTYPLVQDVTAVDTGAETVTIVGHGFVDGDVVFYSSTGTAIGGLTIGSYYYVRMVTADTFSVCTNRGLATGGGAVINLTSAGTGTSSFQLDGPYVVVSDGTPATVNARAKVLKVGYRIAEAGYVRVQVFASWDDANDVLRGLWAGYRITTVDAGDFAYDFRGGEECMAMFARISTAWTYFIMDEWTGITGFVEATTVIGELQADAVAGAGVVLQLDVGEAALFTTDHWYYLYDFNVRNVVEYVQITARDEVGDTVTIATLSSDISTGAVIGAYPHRYATHCPGVGSGTPDDMSYWTGNTIGMLPYFSGIPGSVFHNQSGRIFGAIEFDILGGIDKPAPDDNGYYACMRPITTEEYRPNTISSPALYMNRQYGKLKNIFHSYGSMAQMLDYRTIDGEDFLKFNSAVNPNTLIMHTESV